MSIFESARDKITDTARSAVSASRELAELSKLNHEIKLEENKIRNTLQEIGQIVYDTYLNENPVESELAEKCEEIKQCEERIEIVKLKILTIKNMKKCSACQLKVEGQYQFCPKCGNSLE